MTPIDLCALLDRIAAGVTTPADAEALRDFLHAPPCADPHRVLAPADPDPDFDLDPDFVDGYHCETPHFDRTDAEAVVAITFVRRRYARGEFVFSTVYTHPDGVIETAPSRRVHFSRQVHHFICDLWETLFDLVCLVKSYDPASLLIHLAIPELPDGAHHYVRAVAEITAAELDALVAGTAPNPYDCT
jgi:hypothetical protein